MFEHIQERRNAVEQNIAKSFVDEADLEKGRQKKTFAIGDTFTRHGITYRCTGISPATGRPTWSKVKDGESSKQEAAETGKQYKKFADDVQKEPEEKKDSNKKSKIDFSSMSEEQLKDYRDKCSSKLVKLQMKKTYPGTDESKKQTENIRDLEEKLNLISEEFNKRSKQKSSKQKLSDLEVGDEVTIVTDNKGKITKKNAKITKVNSASFEVGGERFFKRTGYHVGMDNVKIEI